MTNKFKVWDGQEMVQAPNYLIDSFGQLYWQFGFDLPEPTTGTVLRYTGLLDKNGTEIFEGDILSHKLGIGFVEYVDNGFWLKLTKPVDEGDERFHWDFSMDDCKIRGNIYENKELLETSQ